MKRLLYFILLTSCINLLATLSLLAGEQVYTEPMLRPDLNVGASVSLFTPHYNRVTNSQWVFQRKATVSLVYGRADRKDSEANEWQVAINYTISFPGTYKPAESGTLVISHEDETANFQSLAVFESLESGHAKVSIDEMQARRKATDPWVPYDEAVNIPWLEDFWLELSIIEEQYELLNVTAQVPLTDSGYVYSMVNHDSHVQLQWPFTLGAESYELEYTFWDHFTQALPTTNAELLRNATRVEVSRNHYILQSTFPKGTIYFRVRPVGRFIHASVMGDYTHRQYGAWSNVTTESTLDGFEKDRIWQYTTAFAEDGLHKKVVSYYDETMRARQAVTFLNDVGLTLVAETDYSVEGQSVMSILPALADTTQGGLFYKPAFNKDANGQAYDYTDFDKFGGADPLATSSGAGRYYSAANPFNDLLYRGYIPDAEGYPMVQARYKRDGTGRMVAQGGAGLSFQLGSGHETSYYYGKPGVLELRRLFGSNVGEVKHYEKNMVVDPNGQVSISYVDQAGQVVATSLSGDTPGNVVALESLGAVTFTENLMESEQRPYGVRGSSLDFTFLNTKTQSNYAFTYDITGVNYGVLLPEGELCMTCEYELKIWITGPNHSPVTLTNVTNATLNGNTVSRIYTGAQIAGQQMTEGPCTSGSFASGGPITFNATFGPLGEYLVSKRLQVLTPDLSEIRRFIIDEGLVPDSTGYIDAAIAAIDTMQCNFSCESYCRTWALETYSWLANDTLALADTIVDCMMRDCWALAQSSMAAAQEENCESIKVQAINQLSPGGHFYNAGFLAGIPNNQDMTFPVKDIAGQAYELTVSNTGAITGIFLNNAPAINAPLYIYDEPTGLPYLVDANTDFFTDVYFNEGRFQSGMAASLFPYHREACHYTACLELQESTLYSNWLAIMADWEMFSDSMVNNPVPAPPAGITLQTYTAGQVNWEALALNDPYFIDADEVPLTSGTCSRLARWNALLADTAAYYTYTDPSTNQTTTFGLYAYTRQAYLEALAGNPATDPDWLIWNLTRGTYETMKLKIQRSCNGCTYYSDQWAIMPNPTILDLDTPAEVEGAVAGQMAGHCVSMCEAQVSLWGHDIEQWALENCGAYMLDTATVNGYLRDYCNASCGAENPFAYLIMEDVPTDPYLQALQAYITSIYTNGCASTMLNEVSQPFDSVYTVVTGTNGQPMTTLLTQLMPCFTDVVDYLNDHVFTNPCSTYTVNNVMFPLVPGATTTGTVTGYPPVSGNGYCFEAIQSQTHTALSFVQVENVPCYGGTGRIVFQFFDEAGNRIDICDIQNVRQFEYQAPLGITVTGPLYTTPSHGFRLTVELKNGQTLAAYLPMNFWETGCTYVRTDSVIHVLPTFNTQVVEVTEDDFRVECIRLLRQRATQQALDDWNAMLDEVLTGYINNQECLLEPFSQRFEATYNINEHHFTLYYYDQAGSLVQTVPPAGVKPLGNQAFVTNTAGQLTWDGTSQPQHQLKTKYRYNTLGQVTWQSSPDGGESRFYYDFAGRLRLSQNAKQVEDSNDPAMPDRWSYTGYDGQGRIVEVGQIDGYSPYTNGQLDRELLYQFTNRADFPLASGVSKSQVTRTHYDLPGAMASFAQNNLRGRVSYTENDEVSTYYDYDIVGNVKNLMHDVQGFAQKRIGYDYDLISGKVNEVRYQDGQADAFYHRYKYDADNRLTDVYTSRDHYIWEHDAHYLYYAHGPLARVELGNDKVAGNDYRYTLQGWIHGVNTPGQDLLTHDAGQDGAGQAGAATNANRWFSRDEYSYALGYHQDAYKPIGGTGVNLGAAGAATWASVSGNLQGGVGLYNGNIAWMVTQLNEIGRQHLSDPVATPSGSAELYVYKYDQLHRIKAMNSYGLDANGSWAADNLYGSAYSYDGNGNIRSLDRKAKGVMVDQLSYRYYAASSNGAAHIAQQAALGESNRLARVYDNSFGNPNDGSYTGSIAPGLTNAYEYDAIGNLVKDNTEGIANIAWNIQGKVDEITYTDPARPVTRYGYDVGGNRLYKASGSETIWYIRDASGNVMAIYTVTEAVTEDYTEQVTRLSEVPIYGSSRIGMERFERVLDVQRDWDEQDPGLLLRSIRLTELLDDSPLASQAGQYTGQYLALRNLGDQPLALDSLELRVKDQPGGVSLAGRNLAPGQTLLVLHGVPQDQQVVQQVLELDGPMLQNVDILWQTNMPMPESGTVVLDLKAGSRRHLLDAAQLGNINNPYRDPQTLNVLAARQTVLTWAQDTASLARWQGVSAKDLNTYLDFNYNTQLDKTLNESSYREGAVLLHRGTAQPLELMDMDHQELYYAEFSSWEFVLADGPRTYLRVRGARVYEQSNHLGNVLTTLSDKVLGRLPDNAYICSHYESIVVSATDYYPFGWEMPGRSVNKAGYRFGFNGVERSPEIGDGHNTTYFREQDTRIARWWQVDPKIRDFESPYVMMGNNPVLFSDVMGDTLSGDKKGRKDLKRIENKVEYKIKKTQQRIEKMLEQKDCNSTRLTKLQGRLQDWQNIKKEIKILKESNTMYFINSRVNYDNPQTQGNIGYNVSSNRVEINYTLGLSKLVHEMKHAYQYEMRDLSFYITNLSAPSTVTNGGAAYDIFDEQEAYGRQLFFMGLTPRDVPTEQKYVIDLGYILDPNVIRLNVKDFDDMRKNVSQIAAQGNSVRVIRVRYKDWDADFVLGRLDYDLNDPRINKKTAE